MPGGPARGDDGIMHAIRQYEFGPADNLRFEDVPDPVPGPWQVRIKVGAAGVHFIDTAIRAGRQMGPAPLPELPMTPGREVAGRIDALGPGAGAEWLDRRVAAHLGMSSGGYAEYAVADVTALHVLPDDLGYAQAVALVGTGRTAVGLLKIAQLTGDDVVLVTSAAGGMGTLFVQAARRLGAVVIGAAGGPAKVAQVLANGATAAVDYTLDSWPDKVRRALDGRALTLVLDGVGGQIQRAALDLLSPDGRLVLFGFSSGEPFDVTAPDPRAIFGLGPAMAGLPGGTRALEEEAFASGLQPAVHSFPLKDAAAHAALETRATTGKVVLLP